MNVTIVLPSLNPDEKLNMVVEGLIANGFTDIVLVNDGSDSAHMEPFEKASAHKEVTLLTHEVNKGKGRALKTAFSYVLENRKDTAGVVTVDGDNQHTTHDIMACAKLMIEKKDKVVLGCRDFDRPDVPPKSKFGNKTTKNVFKLFCGMNISDTQTGLRAIPRQYLELLIEAKGERFEYETEMFFVLKNAGVEWVEQTIDTVYIEENATTHFNPIVDSFKIYRTIFKFIFKYMLSSLASFVLDIGLFTILIFALSGRVEAGVLSESVQIAIATFVARAFSSLFNYFVNHKAVFGSKESIKSSIWKYYVLCVIQACCSFALVSLFSGVFAAGSALKSVIKFIVDTCLFFASYQIQRKWVFKV